MKKTFLMGSLVGLFVMLFLAAAVSAVAPTITAHATSPTTVYPNTDFKFNMTATDSDNATIIGYVQFYVNGTSSGSEQSQLINNNTNTLIGTLSHSSFDVGNTLIAEYWAGDGTNTTAKANTTAVTVQNSVLTMLEIYDLDVYVDDSKDSNLKDGDTIGKEAKPKSNIKFDFVIKNLFDEDDEDIEIENIFITVTIKEIDDGDDLEEETKEFDLDAEEKSSIKSVEFDLPTAVDEGSYDVEIVVEGEEAKSPYTEHRVEWTLKLEVEKEKHDMKLERAEFDKTTLSCDREATFSVKLVNFGSSDEDELILTIENSALGINIKQEDIEIDEGDDWSKSYTITVADNIAPGIYKVITKMYYDSSDYYDKDFELNAYGSTDLVISKCVVTPPVEEEVPEEEEEGEVIITPEEEGEEEETITGEITREVSFQDTSLYLVLLVTAVVILAGIFLTMIFRLFPRR